MKLAIHHTPGSFSDRWLSWCSENEVEYTLVDGYASDILNQLEGHDAFLWHWNHTQPTALMMAQSVLAAAERMGLVVYPDRATCWHYDDKIAQKYLLESLDVPLVPTWVFYDRASVNTWLRTARFPKVWKLRRGAGSSQVRLLRNAGEARRLMYRAFLWGFLPVEAPQTDLGIRVRREGGGRKAALTLLRRAPMGFYRLFKRRMMAQREKGYFYVQEFMPGNVTDTRITVIGDRAFALRRRVRPNDFRASGSGNIDYDQDAIHKDTIRIAFEIAQRTGAKSLAVDFVMDRENRPCVIEMSYAFPSVLVRECPGYWTSDLTYVEAAMDGEVAMLEDVAAAVAARKDA